MMMSILRSMSYIAITGLSLTLGGCGGDGSDGIDETTAPPFESDTPLDLKSTQVNNPVAYIAPQCYTKTEASDGRIHNSCYTCHLLSVTPNFTNDVEFQQEYAFPSQALKNPWSNLFEDRSARIADQTDAEILAYIAQDNYHTASGDIRLAERTANVPTGWDFNGNGRWDGYVPDCHYSFDEEGFDRTPDGSYTGWRAYAYYPFPTTYWPTNGATGDALIRLARAFQTKDGVFDLTTYKINLAIVESLIRRTDVTIEPVNENVYGVDLDKDGVFGEASRVTFDWAPLEGRDMAYIGDAAGQQLAAGLFPVGTEFLQSLRYLDVQDDGTIALSPRMKELRYAKKQEWLTYNQLRQIAADEAEEAIQSPDDLDIYVGNVELGITDGDTGWRYQGFIEDRGGELRPQTLEETTACMGCHGGLGATSDTIFSFPRKVVQDDARNGWYHWNQQGIAGLNEPKVEIAGAGVYYEYTYYLMYNRSANEFRDNPESETAFFDADGIIKQAMVDKLHDDIGVALFPSRERALALNKAYRTIVQDQDFSAGRDVNTTPVTNVHDKVEPDQPTGVANPSNIATFAGCYGGVCSSKAALDTEDSFELSVLGVGLGGPDGVNYEVDWDGVIHKSRYALGVEGLTFTFPPRLTLPTREIVPLRGIPGCYKCHRLASPVVDDDRQPTVTLNFPPTDVTPAEAEVLTRLTNDSARDTGAKWSPDGATIAFVSNRSGSDQIWLIDANGGNLRQLTFGPAKHGWPEWRQDSARLVYWEYDATTEQHAIKTIAADGSDEVTVVTSNDYLDRPTWRPDGAYIAFAGITAGNWDLWVSTSDGSFRWRLTTDTQMETNPLWSPDGGILGYKVAPDKEYNLTLQYFMTFENGFTQPTVHIWNGPESVQMNDWSPDGQRIAYTAEIISGASGEDRVTYANIVSELSLEDGEAVANPSMLISKGETLGDRGPVFSPDGKQVAFWSWDTSLRATLWLHDQLSDDVRVRQLTTSGFDTYPQWSPDGTRLVFESTRGGNPDLWVIRLK